MSFYLGSGGNNKIEFAGESNHVVNVRSEIKQYISIGEPSIGFLNISVPGRRYSRWPRLIRELLWLIKYDGFINRPLEALVFSSMTPTLTILLRLYFKLTNYSNVIIYTYHGVLSELTKYKSEKNRNKILHIQNGLKLPTTPNMYSAVLGKSILGNLKKHVIASPDNWLSINHPYIMRKDLCGRPPENRPTVFSFLGANIQGMNSFSSLVKDLSQQKEKANYWIIGHNEEYKNNGHVDKIFDEPLSRSEYEKHISETHYVIWLSPSNHYKYSASGTLLDAVAFAKPGIYLNNDLIKYYFSELGDIGYLCDSITDIILTVEEIMNKFPASRYAKQINNLTKAQSVFSPAAVGKDIYEKIEVIH